MGNLILTILKIQHFDKNNNCIWEDENLHNIIHKNGEAFCLGALFRTSSTPIPANYYAGLDNRTIPASSDTLSNLSQEPTQFGYARQPISSANGFTIALNDSGINQATSGVVVFTASGGTWGPIKNLFFATTSDNSGTLISTAELGGSHSVNSGERLTLQIALNLRDV